MPKIFILLFLVFQTAISIATTTSDWIFKRANSCLIPVKGGDHNSVVLANPAVFDQAIRDAIVECGKAG